MLPASRRSILCDLAAATGERQATSGLFAPWPCPRQARLGSESRRYSCPSDAKHASPQSIGRGQPDRCGDTALVRRPLTLQRESGQVDPFPVRSQ